MNPKDSLAFLGLLSSKICHDIVAPVSAIDMGISLLEDHLSDNLRSDPAYLLLKDSLDKTLRRINFFRYAFAFGKTDSIPTKKEFVAHCENACTHFKINFMLDEFNPNAFQQTLFLRVIACIIYLLTDTLPKGGTITLSISNALTTFEVEGPMVIISHALQTVSQGSRESLRAQTILPELILIAMQDLGVHLQLQSTPTSITALLKNN